MNFRDFKKQLDESLDDPLITRQDLVGLERLLDAIYSKLDIDIEFTKHFLDRVNDARNVTQIRISELIVLFQKEFAKYGDKIAAMGDGMEAVMTDLVSDINIPFALNWNAKDKQMELVTKTVMRKHNFMTRTKKFAVR